MSSGDTTVTKTEAIASLVLKNMDLEKCLKETNREHDERVTSLLGRIVDLEEKCRRSVEFSLLEYQIKQAFNEGQIPLPKVILEQKRPVSIEYKQCHSYGDCVVVSVTITSGVMVTENRFMFKPTLLVRGKIDPYYPDFCPETFIKPLAPTRKARVKKLTPAPPADCCGVVIGS